jgi:glycosyltransferase involved in cell wall biosynthesis
MYVIPNGVEVTNYQNPVNRADLRAMFGLPPEVTLIGSVGRLTHQKGFDLLLQALTLVSNDNTHLVIVGNGEEESQLKSQAARLGLEQHVHFAGYRRDVPQLLGALDLYVHPARFEGMPNALLEAMAAGCPIVASSVDGNCELITDGIHGWLVIPENVNALACAMRTALNNPTEAQQRGRCAQEHVARKYSVEAMVTAWERVLVNL